MPQAAPSGAVGCYREAGTPQALVESLVILFTPHRYNATGLERCMHIVNGPAAVERVVTMVRFCVRSAVQIEDNGVEACIAAIHGTAADAVGHIADLHGDPWIIDGVIRKRSQGAAAPFD